MVEVCDKITDIELGYTIGFLLLVVSNVCRMEPTQVVWLCSGQGRTVWQ